MANFKIRIPKVDKKLKETYTDAELDVLLKKPNLKTCGFLEYKIWVFSNYLLGTGNRISTAINLKIKDIDFDSKRVRRYGDRKIYLRIFKVYKMFTIR